MTPQSIMPIIALMCAAIGFVYGLLTCKKSNDKLFDQICWVAITTVVGAVIGCAINVALSLLKILPMLLK